MFYSEKLARDLIKKSILRMAILPYIQSLGVSLKGSHVLQNIPDENEYIVVGCDSRWSPGDARFMLFSKMQFPGFPLRFVKAEGIMIVWIWRNGLNVSLLENRKWSWTWKEISYGIVNTLKAQDNNKKMLSKIFQTNSPNFWATGAWSNRKNSRRKFKNYLNIQHLICSV